MDDMPVEKIYLFYMPGSGPQLSQVLPNDHGMSSVLIQNWLIGDIVTR